MCRLKVLCFEQGCATSSGCEGDVITVGGDGSVSITVPAGDEPMIAIHVGKTPHHIIFCRRSTVDSLKLMPGETIQVVHTSMLSVDVTRGSSWKQPVRGRCGVGQWHNKRSRCDHHDVTWWRRDHDYSIHYNNHYQ